MNEQVDTHEFLERKAGRGMEQPDWSDAIFFGAMTLATLLCLAL
jgi:hypothetical protein